MAAVRSYRYIPNATPMPSLRANLGPIVLLIAALLVATLVFRGIMGYDFPRWLIALTMVL